MDKLLIRCVFAAPAQVFLDRAGEQLVFLQDHRDRAAQRVEIVAAHIDAADLHAALRHVIQAGDELHKARFRGTGAADDADRRAGRDRQINVAQNGLAVVFVVAEPHVVEYDAAVLNMGDGVFRRRDVRRLVEQLDGALARGAGHRDHDEDHREAHQAHEDLRRVRDQAQKLAGRKAECRVAAAGHDGARAEPRDQDDCGVHAKLHQRGVPSELLLRLFEVLVDALGDRVEFLLLVVLAHERFDDADAVQVFLHDAVEVVIRAENALEDRVRPRHNKVKAEREHRDDREEDQRELRVDRERRDERKDHHQRAAHRHADDHLVCILQVRHVGRQAGDDARRRKLINVREREGLHLVEHVVAQVPREAARGLGGKFA